MTTNDIAVDSLIANEFSLEINGEAVSGIFRISGLTTFKLGGEGNRHKPAFAVSKMVQRDPQAPFNRWMRDTQKAQDYHNRPRRDVTISAVDDGIVTRRWTFKNAWISEVSYSDFDSASFEMVAETIVIMYDDLDEQWANAE